MGKGWKLSVVVVIALAALAGSLFWSMVRRGFSTQEEPSALEALAARNMRSWATPADLRGVANPLPLSSEILTEARAHWADHCAICHGNDGKGKTDIGSRLYPRAPDMTMPATQELSDGELFAIIENGVRLTGMPGWGAGTAESGYESWGLVHFVRRLPELTAEELAEMEALNPKSPAEWEALQAEREFLEGGAPPPKAGDESDHHH